ncbi:MAG: hemerythrin family protein [Thiotrichales bacterium]|jgi:hypothetical protein|nr:hemerythrin family protein [Thiotrichales bacterium]MBT3614203.1 hemerythrin family protein [Thiotrichales bacterium]MBT3752021.1 hemerythrin family protein [Thiotrichales bacterium]MBT3837404.1 hemerythrin family protein [Thiotrichales bacterium]MBT4152689.1 hemerythrin family protein [Thiotrichales bacterium]
MATRGLGQKISYSLAIASYTSAIGLFVYIWFYDQDTGTADSIIASMMAGIVFLVGVGVVLHVIGKANIPSFKVPSDEEILAYDESSE